MLPLSADNALSSASGLRWLYVDFNSYFASVEQELRPELRGKPVAVVPVEPELFDALPDADLKSRAKAEKLSQAVDKINHRFGRDSVLVGMLPSQGRSFSGSKIAFTRIPDMEEFLE